MGRTEEEQTAARDFVMARLAACRTALGGACNELDDAISFFLDPEDDKKGEKRAAAIETIDELIGMGARLVQQAAEALPHIDPTEAEDLDDDEEEDDKPDDARDEVPRKGWKR